MQLLDIKKWNLKIHITEIYAQEFIKILQYILDNAPQKRILFQTRYQGGDKEIIVGVIKWSQFLDMLNSKKVFFNVCYIVEED